jgi:hypothetical protein
MPRAHHAAHRNACLSSAAAATSANAVAVDFRYNDQVRTATADSPSFIGQTLSISSPRSISRGGGNRCLGFVPCFSDDRTRRRCAVGATCVLHERYARFNCCSCLVSFHMRCFLPRRIADDVDDGGRTAHR